MARRGHRLRRQSDQAAERATQALEREDGPSVLATNTSAQVTPNAQFAFLPVDALPKRRRASHVPKLPKALAEAAEIYVGLGPNSRFSQLPVLPEPTRNTHLDPLSAFLRVPGDTASKGFGLHNEPEPPRRGGTPSDDGADSNGISMNWAPLVSRHHARRAAQHATWIHDVIPSLIQPFLEYLHDAQDFGNGAQCGCRLKYTLNVVLAHWDVHSREALIICDCNPAAKQLIRRGFFPCAPRRPSIAFSLPLLEFISIHSLNVAPNSSAWADTLHTFWQRRNLMPNTSESLRKRLANSLHWYQVLLNRKEAHVEAVIAASTRASLTKRTRTAQVEEPGQRKRRRVDAQGDRPTVVQAEPADEHTAASARPDGVSPSGEEVQHSSPPDKTTPVQIFGAPGNLVGPDASGSAPRAAVEVATAARDSQSAAEEEPASPVGSDDANASDATKTRNIPSELLQRRCPLCFGGEKPALEHTNAHVLVCIDANFAQKRRKSAQSDPGLTYLGSRFLPEDEVREMEAEVDKRRKRPKPVKKSEVSDDVLNECERSFIAAQEAITKASKNYYADTGLMAILCRHDRILWVVNMTSAGEKQYYALALLNRVMNELPADWNVGVLYDIGCQLSRSINRFGFLEPFASRLSFAVSVFHAYGHQWICQLVYHPRKRSGFGLTDGEGCERFWSAIRRLIAVLRVCGFFRRLFTLNRQFDFIDKEGVKKFGKWLARRWRDCMRRMQDAEDILAKCSYDEASLQEAWDEQVKAQLVQPTRQNQKAGDKEINNIILQLGRAEEVYERVKMAESKLRRTAQFLPPSDLQALTESIDAGKREVKSIRARVKLATSALGTQSARQLQALRGNAYVCARVNARALRANIREAVRGHKFERERLERAYRRQVMQHKEHTQTKDLVHKRHKKISAMVTAYNKLVMKMEVLIKQGKVPVRRTRPPRRLDTKQLFKLDVDDVIWQEDPGLGPQDEGEPPRWLVDDEIRTGIPAMHDVRRCREELERLSAESNALARWWHSERAILRSSRLDGLYGAEVQARLQELDTLAYTWTMDLASSGLSVSFDVGQQFERTAPPLDEQPKGYGLPDDLEKDDDSDIMSEEEEDEPVADHLDEVADADLASDDEVEELNKWLEDDDAVDGASDKHAHEGRDSAVSSPAHELAVQSLQEAPASQRKEGIHNPGHRHQDGHTQNIAGRHADNTRVLLREGDGAPTTANSGSRAPRLDSGADRVLLRDDVSHACGNEDVPRSPLSRRHSDMQPHAQTSVAPPEAMGSRPTSSTARPSCAQKFSEAIVISSSDDSDSDEGQGNAGEPGRRCGPYDCTGAEVLRFVQRTTWVSGDGIAVLAESFMNDADRTVLGVVPSTVYRDLKDYSAALENGDAAKGSKVQHFIANKLKLARVPHPSTATRWLVVVHVEVPPHWTLVELQWQQQTMAFYDSFATREGYPMLVQAQTRLFLEVCSLIYGRDFRPQEWTWVAEQTNGYDCGPFVVADLESFIRSGTPSAVAQSDMRAWRARLAARLRAMTPDVRTKAMRRAATVRAIDQGAEVIEIEDA